MMILNIETSTNICSIALAKAGKVIAFRETEQAQEQIALVTVFIQQCLEEVGLKMNDLDAVAVSSGPGSYTSLRVGASVAKGICYALDKPLIVVDTLQALAKAAQENSVNENIYYVPMIDARRMEVFFAMFDYKNEKILKNEALIIDEKAFEQYFLDNKTLVFCGSGAEKCKETIIHKNAVFSTILCSARHLASISQEYFVQQKFVDIAYFEPEYLKAPNITASKKSVF